MKRKEVDQLKNKSEAELKTQTVSLRDNLWNLKKDVAAGKVKNASQMRQMKKDIARTLTFLNSQTKTK